MTDTLTVYLGLGSNLGNRQDNLDMALKLLGQRMRIGKVSSIYDTEPLGNTSQPRFLNIACQVYTRLSPEGLLTLAKGIENKMGRHGRSGEPRPIDIDILLYGDTVMETPTLTIPHPKMGERSFVLVPLAEIAPDAVHPVTKQTVREMGEAVKEKQGVFKWESK
ncbi:MAG: 2-amino-4-hydroxy-6-hydroxymethyldihydropteridine diphosphokinase [Chloroflexi bacterium RBG_16_56_11]|nr:MAG: 2-amino-4-hydroxy-6-hydroxymethyldihydropteridine diphosphokinase [Chloroflexi bacterium RBG_16_56_11]